MNNPASKVRPSRLVSANLLWALAFLVPITIIVGVAWPRTLGAHNELRLDRSSLAVTSQTSTIVGLEPLTPPPSLIRAASTGQTLVRQPHPPKVAPRTPRTSLRELRSLSGALI